MHFAHHRRQHVAVFEMEIVVGAVKVGGHHGNIVGAVLEVERLAEFEAGDFCYGIWLVGVFERRSEQRVFRDGLRSFAGVDASRAEEQKFLHSVAPSLADYVLLNLEVLVDEIGAVNRVGHDAANVSGGEHYGVGAFFIEKTADCFTVEQVEFAVGAAHEVGISAAEEIVPYCGADKSAMAGDVYFRIFVKHSSDEFLICIYWSDY